VAKTCVLTGKKPMYGNRVSHAMNKTRRRQEPNLQWKRIWLPDEGRFVRIRISAAAMRMLSKRGPRAAFKAYGVRKPRR